MTDLPPHNRDAERDLLGYMLRETQLISEIVMLVREKDFYVFGHQKIFECITGLADRGKAVDVVTVAAALQKAKLIEEVGGVPYLAELIDRSSSSGAYRQYAEIIREKSIARQLINAGSDMAARAFDPTQSSIELLEQAERDIFAIAESGVVTDTATVQEAISEMSMRWETRQARGGELAGVTSGFVDLDAVTAGFHDSELTIIAARPSLGKTALGLAIAVNVATQGLPVLFVSLEQAKAELAERMVVTQARVDGHKVRTGWTNADEMTRLLEASTQISELNLFIDDTSSQGMMRIAANARRLKRRANIRLVVVDYIQLIDPDNRREPRQEQVAGISRRLKFLARELKIPVICMAQLNRDSEKTSREPKLSDLRESGAIEQDADVVMLLWRPGSADIGDIEIIIAKNRNGKQGRVSLRFEKAFMAFSNTTGEML